MRRLMILAAAMSLLLPAMALAQNPPNPQQNGRPARPAPTQGPTRRPAPPAARRPVHPGGRFTYRGRSIARIHGPVFHYPRGWHYRRWRVGALFPRIFLTRTYFYTGWAPIGLPAPGAGFAWVRFGPDLVLVNLRTFRVRDVVYGVFY